MSRYSIPVFRSIGDVRSRLASGEPSTPILEPAPRVAAPPPPPALPPPPDPAEMRRLFASLEDLVQEHEQRRQESLGELQQLAVELAVAVASQVVSRAIDADQFGVKELVQSLVGRLGLAEPIKVTLHPQDLALLEAHLKQEPATWDPKLMSFRGDPLIPRGSCRGTSARGDVLAESALHLAELRRHLLEGLDDAEIERRHSSPADQRLRRFPDRRETA